MMSATRCVLFCLASFFVISLVQSTEFIPCFIWSNKRTSDKVPALNKISQDIFKEGIEKHLKDDSIDSIVIFAEQTLSPEDFIQHDQSGIVFSNLAKLAKTMKVSYLPYVQNPIKALKHLDATVTEVPLDKLGKGFELPETDILIVNLKDATDSENRIDMLKRHDSNIASLYKELTKSHKNILCIYTAHHTSWVASEEVVESRQRRSLLQAEETPVKDSENKSATDAKPKTVEEPEHTSRVVLDAADNSTFWNSSHILLYMSAFKYNVDKIDYNATSLSFALESINKTKYVLTTTVTGQHTIFLNMTFSNDTSAGYWMMDDLIPVTINNGSGPVSLNLTSTAPIVARNKFSFHCGDQVFVDSQNTLKTVLKNFQIQLYFSSSAPNNTKFNDAYDCVGFTTVPIWSGLFVTTILLIIMTLGITMMMDIRTMDKFDDAKGKTITINAE